MFSLYLYLQGGIVIKLGLRLTTSAEDFQERVFRTILKDNVKDIDVNNLKEFKDVKLALLESDIKLLWIGASGSTDFVVQVKKGDNIISKYKVVCDIIGVTNLNYIGNYRLERILNE